MLALPFNLQEWIETNMSASLGAVGNKEVFKGSDFIYQIIKGPNARNDFHLDPWDEIFFQLKGHIFVHVMDEGREKRLRVGEGEVFLVPKNIYHSPRRPPGSVGLVVERPRARDELDAAAWFCEKCGHKLHEVKFWCDDIEKTLPAVLRDFNDSLELRTCGKCRAVLPDPRLLDPWG